MGAENQAQNVESSENELPSTENLLKNFASDPQDRGNIKKQLEASFKGSAAEGSTIAEGGAAAEGSKTEGGKTEGITTEGITAEGIIIDETPAETPEQKKARIEQSNKIAKEIDIPGETSEDLKERMEKTKEALKEPGLDKKLDAKSLVDQIKSPDGYKVTISPNGIIKIETDKGTFVRIMNSKNPKRAEHLVSKDSLQSWVDAKVSNFEKKHPNLKPKTEEPAKAEEPIIDSEA